MRKSSRKQAKRPVAAKPKATARAAVSSARKRPAGRATLRHLADDGLLHGVEWQGGLDDGRLVLLDQTALPAVLRYVDATDLAVLRQHIIDLVVRGAPAIGIAGAYGLVAHCWRATKQFKPGAGADALEPALKQGHERLVTSRPTAVNLRFCLDRLRDCFHRHLGHLTAQEMVARLLMEARRIHREDAELCARIADNGAALLPDAGGVYTHCNTGSLATGGMGTALGCIIRAHRSGKRIHVIAGETRPLLQGARLTALELLHAKVPVRLCTDSMAASVMSRGMVQAVIVGADRICANGDTANKIGTCGLAVLARHYGIPFYVAAPYSTFDLALPSGERIEIEERKADEVRAPQGTVFSPPDVPVVNPAFDVTPAKLITAIITERGVIHAPDVAGVARLMGGGGELRSEV